MTPAQQHAELLYGTLCTIGLGFFVWWAIRDGVIRRSIEFGLIGKVRKRGIAARNWGLLFAFWGIAFLLLTLSILLRYI